MSGIAEELKVVGYVALSSACPSSPRLSLSMCTSIYIYIAIYADLSKWVIFKANFKVLECKKEREAKITESKEKGKDKMKD